MLPREARQVLAELELLSHGKGAALNSSGRGGDDPSRPPHGEANPPHLIWRERMERCETDKVLTLVAEARLELEQTRGFGKAAEPKPVGETQEQWEARLIADGNGWDASTVAKSFRCLVRDVVKVRVRHDRDPSTGRLNPAISDRDAKILRMHANGRQQREIARFMAINQATVSRVIRRLADSS